MPDHAHLILRPDRGYDLSRIMKGTKGATARRVNEARGKFDYLWQDESWDRILRNQDELDEKMKLWRTSWKAGPHSASGSYVFCQ